MKKIYLFMLMAVGLLISGNLRAAGDKNDAHQDAVCKIGDQYYSTFALAVTDANATTNATITLLQEEVAFDGATLSKAMTLDLNGKTLKFNTKTKTITISVAGTISIQNGTLSDGGVAVSNGLITMAKDKAILNLTNVHLSCPTGGYPIYTKTATPTININEGTTLEGKSGLCYFTINTKVNNKVALEGVINVAKGKTLSYSGTGSLVLTGGYLPKDWKLLPTGVSIADGKIGVNTWDKTYGECLQIAAGTDVVAKIGDYEYAAVNTAIAAATNGNPGGQIIVMQKDADLTAAATMVVGSTLDLNGFTLHPTAAIAILTCGTTGSYLIKNGKIDAGEITPEELLKMTKASVELELQGVMLINKGKYGVYATATGTILNFDAATTFSAAVAGVYAYVNGSTTSPLTINQTDDYAMSYVKSAGYWRMIKKSDAKFEVDGMPHTVWSEAIVDASRAAGKTLKLLDNYNLTAATTLHNGTLDLNRFTLHPTTTTCSLTCSTTNGGYTIKNGKIDAGEIKPTQLISLAKGTGMTLTLEDVDLVNNTGNYDIYVTTTGNTLTFDKNTTFSAAIAKACWYVKGNTATASPLTLKSPMTGDIADYAMAHVTAGTWYMIAREGAKFEVDGIPHMVWSEALYDAKLADGKTLKMFDDVTLTAATTLHNGTLDLNNHTMSVKTTACSLTCSTTSGAYTIKNGKIDAGDIKIDKLISLATGTGMTLTLEDVDLVNNIGKYDIYVTSTGNTLTFDKKTTFRAATAKACWYVKNDASTDSPLTIISPMTGNVADYAMAHVAAGTWYMIARDGAKFEVDGIPHMVWSEALYDAKLADGKTLKLLDETTVALSANTALHNGILDLNNHELSTTGNNSFSYSAADNVNVTIKNGSITSAGTKPTLLINTKTGMSVNLKNVKISTTNSYPIQVNTASTSNTLTIDADCELTGKTYAMYVADACTPTINNYAILTQNIYATADPSLTINNYGTIPGIYLYADNAKNHTIKNYAGGQFTFKVSNKSFTTGQVTLHNEGTLDIQKIVSDMIITGNGTFKLVPGLYINIDLPAATYVDLAEGTIIHADDLQDVGAAPEGLKWLNTMHGGIPACKLVKADAETICKIGDYEYISLADAVAAVPTNGTETKIIMQQDVATTNGVTIANHQNVLLELNGKVLSCNTNSPGNFAIITNKGILTIQDNTDVNYDGSGTGKITTIAYDPDMKPVPGYATNTITNYGKITIKSGFIESGSLGSASFAIDCQAENVEWNKPSYGFDEGKVELYIEGGKVKANTSNSIRQYLRTNGTCDNIIEITGGIVYRLWVQDNTGATAAKGSLTIKNATLPEGLKIGYVGVSEHFALNIDNTIFGEYFLYMFDQTKSGNTFSITNSAIGSFYMTNPSPLFDESHKNTYNFAHDVNVPNKNAISAAESLHLFHKCIIPGNGLIAIEYEGFDNPYKLGKLVEGKDYGDPDTDEQTTRIDPEGGDDESNLANYWHKIQTWENAVVPEAKDPVVIDHNVIVEAGTEANAASIIIDPNQKLIVEEGATLHIEDAGALFKDETAQMIVNSGAVVTVGANGVIADNTNNIIIQSTEKEQGIFMISPEVSINTEPSATVELYTKCKQISSNPYEYIWQRFAIPTKDGEATVYKDNHTAETPLFSGETSFVDAVYGWDDNKQDWYILSRWKDMDPFKGYQLTNNTADGKITYSFEGNLVGNHDGNYEFKVEGFHFFGNSYTAPIYIASFLESIAEESNGVQTSLWIYDVDGDNFVPVTKLAAEIGSAKYKDGTPISEVRSMQAFIMNTTNPSATSTLSYADAIWGNPRYQPGTPKAPARATIDFDMATINISAENGQADQITLIQSNDFSAEYEDGADAAKYMYADGINIYANTNCGQLSNVATDDVDGTILAFKSGKSSEYILSFDNINGGIFTLVDMQTGAKVEMKAGNEYSFTQTPNTNDEARFMVMGGNKAPTGNEKVKANKVTKLINNGQFFIIKNGALYNGLGVKF